MHVSYTHYRYSIQYVLGCQLIINHGNIPAAEQGLQVSLLVALSCRPVAPLPARGDYTLSKSTQHNLSVSSLHENSDNSFTFRVICCIFFCTCNPSAVLLSSGDYGHNEIQHSCVAGYSYAPLCLHLHVLYPHSSAVCEATEQAVLISLREHSPLILFSHQKASIIQTRGVTCDICNSFFCFLVSIYIKP